MNEELDWLQIIVEQLAEMKNQSPVANLSESDRKVQEQISQALTGIYEQIKILPKNSELLMQLNEAQKVNADLFLDGQKQQTEIKNLNEKNQILMMMNQSKKSEEKDQNADAKFHLVNQAANKFSSGQSLIAYIIGAVGAISLIGSLVLVFTIRGNLSAKTEAEKKIAFLDEKYPHYANWIWVWRFENEIEKTKNVAANNS